MFASTTKNIVATNALLWLLFVGANAQAEVIRKDFLQLGNTNKAVSTESAAKPIYEWRDTDMTPKAVVVTIHGVSLHGGVFDTLGKYLASEGYVVVSPDLMGHGRRYYNSSVVGYQPMADYEKAEQDLFEMMKQIRATYPGLKVFWLGESLGANYAIRIAAKNPELADGLILSAPTIRRHHATPVRLAMGMCVNTVFDKDKQLSLKNYTKRYIADTDAIINDYLSDPLMRKSLSPNELLSCRRVIKSTLPFADHITNLPVLVIQGTDDKMVKSVAAEELLGRMKSKDRILHWAEGRGHLLFMTDHVQPELEVVVSRWLNNHVSGSKIYTTASELTKPSDTGCVAN